MLCIFSLEVVSVDFLSYVSLLSTEVKSKAYTHWHRIIAGAPNIYTMDMNRQWWGGIGREGGGEGGEKGVEGEEAERQGEGSEEKGENNQDVKNLT